MEKRGKRIHLQGAYLPERIHQNIRDYAIQVGSV